MKGFLSLLGITLIVAAFGLITFSFYGNPLEELTSQERKYAYNETRQNHAAQTASYSTFDTEDATSIAMFSLDSGNSCENPKQ